MTSLPTTFVPISDGWTVSAVEGPVPASLALDAVPAGVPGCVHTDLLRAGLIADPFDADNEAAQQWIGDTAWRYATSFEWVDDAATRHDLVAHGLDTVAVIELNGIEIGRTQNQHRSYRFDVRDVLRPGPNDLVVTFAAPVPEAERRDAEHGAWPHTNHHPYNQLRKSASNFGWDWGIDVATSGIWKPIGIDSWSSVRIDSVRPLVGLDGPDGVLTAQVAIERDGVGPDGPVRLEVSVADVTASTTLADSKTSGTAVLRVADVAPWWPVGHGEQPLYDVSVSVASGDAVWRGRVGFRTVEIDTSADAAGNRFVVRVNGRDILVRGVNWIPDHAFVTEVDRARYARRIADALEANVNFIRVWGGGIYESDDFYDLADEAGLMVWQDFLFACAAYSEDPWLAAEVEAEAREQITRLSAHPSLVIWNGNNENIWGYVEWGWRPALAGRGWGDTYYRELLPRLIAELDPTRPYSPGSPFSFVDYAHPNDQRNGTMHIWDVWNQRDYTLYRDYAPRFVSEFGFQGPPAWSTLTRVVHDQPLDPYGHEMLVHQKAREGNHKLEVGMAPHLPAPATIEDWHWSTQLNQAQAIRFGVEHFRSLTPHNTGVVLWQLNDDWPVISWAAVDFDEHRKPLWFAMRDAYAPRLVTVQPRAASTVLVLVNDTAEPFEGVATMRRLRFDATVVAGADVAVSVPARGTASVEVPGPVAQVADPGGEVLRVVVEGFGATTVDPVDVVAQRLDPDAARASAVRIPGGYRVEVTARSYLRDVFLQVDRVDPRASVDEGLVSLMPGETLTLTVRSDLDVNPAAFVDPLVLRCANDLVRGPATEAAVARP